jgi:hypothetical protein
MLAFKANKLPLLYFMETVKKTIRIKCVQIQEPFSVKKTLSGIFASYIPYFDPISISKPL